MTPLDLRTRIISFLPLGDQTVASSRLRCFKLRAGLESSGFKSQIGFDEHSDILFLQKGTDDISIDAARRCKDRAGTLIFDIDDFPNCPAFIKNASYLISLADAVTTATPEQKAIAIRMFQIPSDKQVFCLPNPLDYDLLEPQKKLHEATKTLKIVWFGNIENYPKNLLKTISSVKDIEFHAITNASAEIRRLNQYCHFHVWSHEDFSDTISKFDVCIISHHGTEIMNAKNANKMATAIVHGLPVIASRTSDYQRLARLAGVDDWLFEDEKGLLRCIERSRDPLQRNTYIRSAQKVVWAQYHIDAVLPLFLEIVREAVSSTRYSTDEALIKG